MKSSIKTVLLTGATGLIGRYLLKDFLLQGIEVVVIARGRANFSARDRIESILLDWESRLKRKLLRPHVIEGDVREVLCGAGADTARMRSTMPQHIRTIDAMIHSAASLRFETDHTGQEPFRTNFEGTKNAIVLAASLNIREFHHVSTAYVCGDRRGVVRASEGNVGQGFQNIYEESKLRAEELVHLATQFDRRMIYRPSIVVGDSTTGFTSTFHTIYSVLKFVRALPERNANNLDWIFQKLNLKGNESKNLVTVDWVSSAITSTINDSQVKNRTLHLTNAKKITAEQLKSAMSEAIAIAHEDWRSMASQSGFITPDDAFTTYLESYRGYFTDDPDFETEVPSGVDSPSVDTWTPAPTLEHSQLVRMFVFAITRRFIDTTSLPKSGFLSQPSLEDRYATAIAVQSAVDRLTLEGDESKTSTRSLSWTLRLSGSNGGVWNITARGVSYGSNSIASSSGSSEASKAVVEDGHNQQPATLPFLHLTADDFRDWVVSSQPLDELLKSGRALLRCRIEDLAFVRTELDSIANACRPRLQKLSSIEEPLVLPIEQHRHGGRRFA